MTATHFSKWNGIEVIDAITTCIASVIYRDNEIQYETTNGGYGVLIQNECGYWIIE